MHKLFTSLLVYLSLSSLSLSLALCYLRSSKLSVTKREGNKQDPAPAQGKTTSKSNPSQALQSALVVVLFCYCSTIPPVTNPLLFRRPYHGCPPAQPKRRWSNWRNVAAHPLPLACTAPPNSLWAPPSTTACTNSVRPNAANLRPTGPGGSEGPFYIC
jgi:hypothetical protein